MDVQWIAKPIAKNGISYLVRKSSPLPRISSGTCSSSILASRSAMAFKTSEFFSKDANLADLRQFLNPIVITYVVSTWMLITKPANWWSRIAMSISSDFYPICIQKWWMPSMRPTINTQAEFTQRLAFPGSCPFSRHGMIFGRTHHGWLGMHHYVMWTLLMF